MFVILGKRLSESRVGIRSVQLESAARFSDLVEPLTVQLDRKTLWPNVAAMDGEGCTFDRDRDYDAGITQAERPASSVTSRSSYIRFIHDHGYRKAEVGPAHRRTLPVA